MSETVMECKLLCKNYGTKTALKDIDFSLEKGKIVGLLGPNGSGKTTLIKIANGLLRPTSGEVLINGKKIGIETKKVVSYLPDCVSLPEWMKVSELISFFKEFYEDFNTEKADIMIKNLGIEDVRFKTLSKGTKEKVQLVLTMSRDADLYLLDEPMGGVDPATRDYILHTIISNYRENSTVVISTHLISDVEKILDEVLFISEGNIVLKDTVDNIREQRQMSVDALFREVFKCQ
ncbi:MAG: ABC transporter ATP-binding protein [Bacillota bacterium]|nr:ABC transporter ATP-binding protein [Bacillota bacterium]